MINGNTIGTLTLLSRFIKLRESRQGDVGINIDKWLIGTTKRVQERLYPSDFSQKYKGKSLVSGTSILGYLSVKK